MNHIYIYICIYHIVYIHISGSIYMYIPYNLYSIYAPASLPLGMVIVYPRPPCGSVVGVDWCECWLMES